MKKKGAGWWAHCKKGNKMKQLKLPFAQRPRQFKREDGCHTCRYCDENCDNVGCLWAPTTTSRLGIGYNTSCYYNLWEPHRSGLGGDYAAIS